MSVNLSIGGVPGTPVTVDLTTSEADVFAPASNGNPTYNVVAISVVNITAGAVVASLYWQDGTTSKLFWRESVAANDTVAVSDILIPLLPGATSGNTVAKKIRGLAASNSAITVTVMYTIAGPQR
jgi:hypothetical protein